MKTKLVLLSLLAVVMTAMTGCSNKAKTVEQIQKAGKIVVATNAEFAPFEYVEGNEFKGIDIEIIKAYAESINVECDIQDQDFDAALLAVSTNKADVAIAGITKNSTREETMSFTNAYFQANQVVIVKTDSVYASLTTEDAILSALTANSATIGAQRGTTGEYYIEGDTDWDFPGITGTTLRSYDNGALAVKALSNGQIDAVIIDIAPAKIYCENISGVKYLDVILTEEEYAIAVSKGNESLINSLNEFITTIKGNGEYDKIISNYFGE